VTIRQSQEAGRIDFDLPGAGSKSNNSTHILSSPHIHAPWKDRFGIVCEKDGIAYKIVSYGYRGEKQARMEPGCSVIPELDNVQSVSYYDSFLARLSNPEQLMRELHPRTVHCMHAKKWDTCLLVPSGGKSNNS
jgi:hypothetical protein